MSVAVETMYSEARGAFRFALDVLRSTLDASAGDAVKSRELTLAAVEAAERWLAGEDHNSIATFVCFAVYRLPTVHALIVGGSSRVRAAMRRWFDFADRFGSEYAFSYAVKMARRWASWQEEADIIEPIDRLIAELSTTTER